MLSSISTNTAKTAQALGYLLNLDDNHKMNRVKLIKLLWAADRFHIRKYGATISDSEDYYAMAHGAVCSTALDIASNSDFLSEDDRQYIGEFFTSDDKFTTMGKNPGTDHLAKTEQASLKKAWQIFGELDAFVLADTISHQYPEWRKFADDLSSGTSRIKMDVEDFFKNPPGEDAYFAQDEEITRSAHEIYLENRKIARAIENPAQN